MRMTEKVPGPHSPPPWYLPAHLLTYLPATHPLTLVMGQDTGIGMVSAWLPGMREGIPCKGVNGSGGLEAYD